MVIIIVPACVGLVYSILQKERPDPLTNCTTMHMKH